DRLQQPLANHENSHRQTWEHRRYHPYPPVAGCYPPRLAKGRYIMGRRKTNIRNFEGQPASGSPHRSRHEDLEARADVLGDTAGTAPAVTSATRLSLRPSLRFSGIIEVISDCASLRCAMCVWVCPRCPEGTCQSLLPSPDHLDSDGAERNL